MTAAEIQAKIDALDVKIEKASVTKASAIGDRSVTNRDLDEMLTYRAHLSSLLATAARGTTTRYAVVSKGC